MTTIDAATLQTLMNRHGKDGLPFVFGVDYELQNCFIVDNPLATRDIWWSISGTGNGTPPVADRCVQPSISPMSCFALDEYAAKFDVIYSGLMRGDSFLANLTASVEVNCNASLENIYASAKARYKLLLPDEFVCFSPECFVRIEHGRIHAYPMKGTIDATIENARQILLDNHKEQCEHNTIVDLLRNDLSMISDNVRVTRFRYIDKVGAAGREILQTSSEIVGDLPDDWRGTLGDIIFRLLPAGSICGAPKDATVRLIARAEGCPRGWYTGIFGYFDGESLDSAVMIRCVAKRGDRLYYHSGGGITVNSDVSDEYNEVLQKIYIPCQ